MPPQRIFTQSLSEGLGSTCALPAGALGLGDGEGEVELPLALELAMLCNVLSTTKCKT